MAAALGDAKAGRDMEGDGLFSLRHDIRRALSGIARLPSLLEGPGRGGWRAGDWGGGGGDDPLGPRMVLERAGNL